MEMPKNRYVSTKEMMAGTLDTLLDILKEMDKTNKAYPIALEAYRSGRASLFKSLPEL